MNRSRGFFSTNHSECRTLRPRFLIESRWDRLPAKDAPGPREQQPPFTRLTSSSQNSGCRFANLCETSHSPKPCGTPAFFTGERWGRIEGRMGETPQEAVAATSAVPIPAPAPESPPVDTTKTQLSGEAKPPGSPTEVADNRASSEESGAAGSDPLNAARSSTPSSPECDERAEGARFTSNVQTVELETDSDATSEDDTHDGPTAAGGHAWGTSSEFNFVRESAVAALDAAEEARKLGNAAFTEGKYYEAQKRYAEACAFLTTDPMQGAASSPPARADIRSICGWPIRMEPASLTDWGAGLQRGCPIFKTSSRSASKSAN